MKFYNICTFIGMFTLIIHFISAYTLIIYFELKVNGAAIASVLTYILNLLILVLVLEYYLEFEKSSYFFICKEMTDFGYIKIFLEFGFKSFILYMLEAFAFEIFVLIASLLEEKYMSANVCAYNFLLIIYAFSFSMNITTSNYVSLGIGKLNKELCLKYIKFLSFLLFGKYIILIPIIYIFRRNIAEIYTSNLEIINIILDIWPYLILLLLIDFYQNLISGILKGLRMHETIIKIWILLVYFFGIPLLFIFVIALDYKIVGLWFTQCFNIFIIDVVISYYLYNRSIEETINEYENELKIIDNNKNNKLELSEFLADG